MKRIPIGKPDGWALLVILEGKKVVSTGHRRGKMDEINIQKVKTISNLQNKAKICVNSTFTILWDGTKKIFVPLSLCPGTRAGAKIPGTNSSVSERPRRKSLHHWQKK